MPLFDLKKKQPQSQNNNNEKEEPENPIIRELAKHILSEVVQHEGEDDDTWPVRQVMFLASCVPKQKNLENLLKAVIEESAVTPCCAATVKKTLGQNIYYYSLKLFRFSFIKNSTRLKSYSNCQYPPGKKSDVCLNPYHYELVGRPTAIPAVHVDTEKIQKGGPVPQRIMDHCYQNLHHLSCYGPPTTFVSGDELHEHMAHNEATQPYQQPTELFVPDSSAPTRNQLLTELPESELSPSTSHTNTPGPATPDSFLTNDDREAISPQQKDEAMDTETEVRRLQDALPPELQACLNNPPARVVTDVAFSEPEHWVSITYYERSRRVGAPVDCRSPYVLVDGFTNPYTTARISLAYFSNPMRDVGTSRALLYIGRGARLYYLGGEVFIECLSYHPIYVQSPNCNQRHGWHAASVVQVPSGCNLKPSVFHTVSMQFLLSPRLCTIRVSFVKGWGSAFHRQQVTATPCWIECHLNGALEWVDNVLVKMGCPSRVCTSFS